MLAQRVGTCRTYLATPSCIELRLATLDNRYAVSPLPSHVCVRNTRVCGRSTDDPGSMDVSFAWRWTYGVLLACRLECVGAVKCVPVLRGDRAQLLTSAFDGEPAIVLEAVRQLQHGGDVDDVLGYIKCIPWTRCVVR